MKEKEAFLQKAVKRREEFKSMNKVIIKRLGKYTHADGIPNDPKLFEAAGDQEATDSGVSKGYEVPEYMKKCLQEITTAPFEQHIAEKRITS